MSHCVIAVDGPAAVGKTTVGRGVAQRLGWTFLDTGVLYRALTWLALQQDIATDDEPRLAAIACALDVEVARPSVADGRDADVLVGGVDVTWDIRAPAVDARVSVVAALPAVRAALVGAQRRAAASGPAVVVGRDIGTVIFPAADLKVFLDASVDERARRRTAELAQRGLAQEQEAVRGDLAERDMLDSSRSSAPLAVAADALRVETEGRSAEAVIEQILAVWRRRAAEQV